MTEQNYSLPPLYDKLLLKAKLKLLTGAHIGSSKDFAAIGAVDSTVIRDPLTQEPIIPGSSLKGKMRTLLVRSECLKTGQLMPSMKPQADPASIRRLFGCSEPVQYARLQFWDAFLTPESSKQMGKKDLDLYMSEIKFENTIDRITSVANPRQIERVSAGAEFELILVYNVENLEEVNGDLNLLGKGLQLLQLDYIGGHGSRGYGRVAVSEVKLVRKSIVTLKQDQTDQLDKLVKTQTENLRKLAQDAVLSV